MCKIWCGADGQTLNPRDGCSCISTEEESALYPDWATPKDKDYAKRLGEQPPMIDHDWKKYIDGQIEKESEDTDEKSFVSSFTDIWPFGKDEATMIAFKAAATTVPLVAILY